MGSHNADAGIRKMCYEMANVISHFDPFISAHLPFGVQTTGASIQVREAVCVHVCPLVIVVSMMAPRLPGRLYQTPRRKPSPFQVGRGVARPDPKFSAISFLPSPFPPPPFVLYPPLHLTSPYATSPSPSTFPFLLSPPPLPPHPRQS